VEDGRVDEMRTWGQKCGEAQMQDGIDSDVGRTAACTSLHGADLDVSGQKEAEQDIDPKTRGPIRGEDWPILSFLHSLLAVP
jgi:hypothetical protein